MLKKTITYTDFDGNKRTEDAYFNLLQSEAVELALELPEGLFDSVNDKKTDEETAATLIEKLGGKGVYGFIKDLVLKSYGIKSSDGRRLEKSDEISKEFSQTVAFDTFLMGLMSDDKAAAEFVTKVIPPELADKIAARNASPASTN